MAMASTTSNLPILDTLSTIPPLALSENAPGTTPTKELLQVLQIFSQLL